MTFEGFPFIVGWELTLACNLRCRHCASSAGRRRPRELTTDEALSLCTQFPDLLVQEVDITGGEPLVRRDWYRIVSTLADLGMRTKLVTNGVLVTDDTARRLKRVGIVAIGVSIDGRAETHDHIRGAAGLHAKTVRGIERLVEAGIPVTAITTVNGLNIDEFPDILDRLAELGVCRWQVQPLFGLGRSREAPELALDRAGFLKFGASLKGLAQAAAERNIELLPGDNVGYFSDFDLPDLPWRGCSAGIVSVGVTADGKVKGCLSLPDLFVEGDLRQRALWDIWFDPEAFPYTRGFRIDQLGNACRGCAWGEQCQGGCTAMAYAATGSPHNNPYCFHRLRDDSSLDCRALFAATTSDPAPATAPRADT